MAKKKQAGQTNGVNPFAEPVETFDDAKGFLLAQMCAEEHARNTIVYLKAKKVEDIKPCTIEKKCLTIHKEQWKTMPKNIQKELDGLAKDMQETLPSHYNVSDDMFIVEPEWQNMREAFVERVRHIQELATEYNDAK